MTTQVLKMNDPRKALQDGFRKILNQLSGDDENLVKSVCNIIRNELVDEDDIEDPILYEAVQKEIYLDRCESYNSERD
jgi:hypothetical protein